MSEGVSTLAFIQREGLGCLIGSVPRMLHAALLALHAALAAGASIRGESRPHTAAQGHPQALVAPQDVVCGEGCSIRLVCLPPPCYDGQECETRAMTCDDMECPGSSACSDCERERCAGMCANEKGLCEDRVGHEEYGPDDGRYSGPALPAPVPAAAPEPEDDAAAMPKADTLPLSPKTAATAPAPKPAPLPTAMPKPEAASPVSKLKVPENRCLSVEDGTTDEWCQSTCQPPSPQLCNTTCAPPGCATPTVCQCGEFVPVNETQKAQQEQDAKNRVADLNAESCDWDQTACVEQVLPNFVTQDCRTCALHVGNCMMTTHLTGENAMKSMTIDDCMDEIAERAEKECGECKSQASHQSYKVRMGLADPP